MTERIVVATTDTLIRRRAEDVFDYFADLRTEPESATSGSGREAD